ncbi:MAG: stage V sporulation protein AE [Clostridia bacterium]|nr:stage V sporulation protein AE [Clostridia bacterium]
MVKECIMTFLIGGVICAAGQLLLDLTKLTPARVLVSFVVAGVFLTAVGLYEPLVKLAGAGATVPITGFGYTLAKGVREAVKSDGLLGALIGGIKGAAAGISAAVLFGYIFALLAKPSDKS